MSRAEQIGCLPEIAIFPLKKNLFLYSAVVESRGFYLYLHPQINGYVLPEDAFNGQKAINDSSMQITEVKIHTENALTRCLRGGVTMAVVGSFRVCVWGGYLSPSENIGY